MDFGGLMTMETAQQSETSNGSGQLKQQRSGPCDDNIWRPSKVPKPADDLSAYCKQQGPTSTLFMRSDSPNDGRGHSTMLSFSSNKSEEIPFLSTNNVSAQDSSTNLPFPLFDSGSYNTRAASAYASGGSNENTPGSFSRFRGPFTPSQWMELEHQALIYKHFVANIPVPHHLLIPIKKSVNPYAFSGLSADPYASSNCFAGNTDPEPGRCRRTDGKKWRCSREAVPDQKYCERHINRGRHRSRKHVEVQNGHAVSGSTTSKVASVAPSSSATVISSSGTLLNNGGASNSLGTVQQQLNSLQPSAANPNTEQLVNRMLGHRGASVISPTICVKPKDSAISVQKQHNGVELSSLTDFGLVSSDSLLNPSQRNSFVNPKNPIAFLNFNDQERSEQHPVHHFIDGWAKEQSSRASTCWPDQLKDWTQLSMSIPMTASDFASSSSSPRQEKLTLSPLRVSCNVDPIQMGLGMTSSCGEPMQKTASWVPVCWEHSLGGPLGEVLNSTAGNSGDGKSVSALNLGTEVWDNSPSFGSSPTGVLQKTTFVSLSNSSSGSSPRGDSKKVHDGIGMCDEVIGLTVASSVCIPSMEVSCLIKNKH